MDKTVTRADVHIGILRAIVDSNSSYFMTKKLAQFIIDNQNPKDEVCSLSSLMYICQKIFEEDPSTLIRMIEVVLDYEISTD